ncbi:MAG: transposase [Alphaproteobacteria bacterium]|nr:transposase [Alphaproteobacteria bacterium]
MTDVMLLDDAQPPRRWSQADREAVLAAAFAPGAVVSDIARQFRVSTGQIYTWRRQLKPRAGFTRVKIAEPADTQPSGVGGCVMLIELAGGRISVSGSASPSLVTAALRALR